MAQSSKQSDGVGVIGTGLMGSAIARALARGGQEVMAWNRTMAKVEALRSDGIEPARSLNCLLENCGLIIICVSDYDSAAELLFTAQVEQRLKGRVLVNHTTGVAPVVRKWAAWAAQNDIGYLDAAIMNYPKAVGREDCLVLYSGCTASYQRHSAQLANLGGQVKYLGEDPASASCFDLGLMGFYYATILGFLQCAASLSSEGIDPAILPSMMPLFRPIIEDTFGIANQMISKRRYEGQQATIDTHFAALGFLRARAAEENVASDLLATLENLLGAAIDIGYGAQELPAVFEVFAARKDKAAHRQTHHIISKAV